MAALLTVGWIATSAFWPDWLRLASVEAEVAVCIVVLSAALALVSAVAIAHTRTEDVSTRTEGAE